MALGTFPISQSQTPLKQTSNFLCRTNLSRALLQASAEVLVWTEQLWLYKTIVYSVQMFTQREMLYAKNDENNTTRSYAVILMTRLQNPFKTSGNE